VRRPTAAHTRDLHFFFKVHTQGIFENFESPHAEPTHGALRNFSKSTHTTVQRPHTGENGKFSNSSHTTTQSSHTKEVLRLTYHTQEKVVKITNSHREIIFLIL